MARRGMDVERVEAAARALGAQASDIDGLVRRLDALVGRLPGVWEGPEASRFVREWWPAQRRILLEASSHIVGLGQSALNNAAEQREVSGITLGAPDRSGSLHNSGSDAGTRHFGPSSTGELVAKFKNWPRDEIVDIQEVVGADGVTRFVVSIPGTHGEWWDIPNWRQQGGWAEDPAIWVGGGSPIQAAVLEQVRDRLRGRESAEIMLVGYSQGGMVAESIAQAAPDLKIAEVLTVGSPAVLTVSDLNGANIVRLQHNSDPVVNGTNFLKQGGTLSPAVGVGGAISAMISSGNADDGDCTFRGGDPFEGLFLDGSAHVVEQGDYDWLADQYDRSTDDRFMAARERHSRFLGGIVAADD